MKFWLSEFTLFSQWLNIMLRFGRPVFPEITGKTKKTASLQQVHGFLSIDAPGQSVSEPEPSQSPTQWVCDGWRCLSRHMTSRPCFDVVHRGNPNPNQRSVLHGAGLGGDWVFPPKNLSEADLRQPQAGHQKGENPVGILSFLVPVVGLEPTRHRWQRILSPPRLPFQHTGTYLNTIPYPG